MPGHFDAEALVFSLRKAGRRVSRATVYRTLDLLAESGVVQRITQDRGGWLYEVTQGRAPHTHLYCTQCGALAISRWRTSPRFRSVSSGRPA